MPEISAYGRLRQRRYQERVGDEVDCGEDWHVEPLCDEGTEFNSARARLPFQPHNNRVSFVCTYVHTARVTYPRTQIKNPSSVNNAS